jgi:predicted nucleic acid-binding protein
MKAFFDTSVLVAVFWGDHVHHGPSLKALASAQRESSACGVHSLAEVYRALTKLPVRPLLPPEQVFLFVEELPARLTLVGLDQAEYISTIRQVAERKLAGSLVYDALLLACARKWEAKTIYTWNANHFREVAPDLASSIRTP